VRYLGTLLVVSGVYWLSKYVHLGATTDIPQWQDMALFLVGFALVAGGLQAFGSAIRKEVLRELATRKTSDSG
jgi:TRAP-type C4-dicarboxylate transport system permease small subunit